MKYEREVLHNDIIKFFRKGLINFRVKTHILSDASTLKYEINYVVSHHVATAK